MPSSRGNNVFSLDLRTSNSLSSSCSEEVDGILHENHFTFISNDLIHDVPFAELCNSMIHTYYDGRDINIEIDIELLNLMMAVQVSVNVYERFKVLQGEMFHPFGCILKPVMGRANPMALGVLLKDM